jgi:hypothetical protein
MIFRGNAQGGAQLLPYTNTSGGTLAEGDIVILDTAATRSVKTVAVAGSNDPLLVVIGGAAGAVVWCAERGDVLVSCDAVAVVAGAGLGTSGAVKVATTVAVPIVFNVACIAVQAKGAGAGTVRARLIR